MLVPVSVIDIALVSVVSIEELAVKLIHDYPVFHTGAFTHASLLGLAIRTLSMPIPCVLLSLQSLFDPCCSSTIRVLILC